MPKDPLKIIGKPNPTPEERAQAEALSKESGRPAKMCRAALLEAGHDVVKARELLDDAHFIHMNTDFDFEELGKLATDNPFKAMQALMRTMAVHSGKPEPELKKDKEFQKAERHAAKYEKQKPKMEEYERRKREMTGTKLKDPVMGELKWDVFWEGRVVAPPFGKLPFQVETDRGAYDVATPPGDEHRKAFQEFVAAGDAIYARVEKANFKYFKKVRPEYVEAFGSRNIAEVEEPGALWKELRSPGLFIPLQRGKAWRVELTWNCSWDEEHGHAVFIEGGKVVKVGLQGEGW